MVKYSFSKELFIFIACVVCIICLASIQWFIVRYEASPVKYYGPPAMFLLMMNCIYLFSGRSKYYYSLYDEKDE